MKRSGCLKVMAVLFFGNIIFMGLFMMFFMGGVAMTPLPTIEDVDLFEYKEISKLSNVSWMDMVVIDTVRYEKDYAKVNKNDTAFDFLIIEVDIWQKYYIVENEQIVDYEMVLSEQLVLDNKQKIIGYIGLNYSNSKIEDVIREYNKINSDELIDIRYSSRDIEEVMELVLDEEQREWATTIIAENLIREVVGEEYVLPDHIEVVSNNLFAWPTPTLNIVTSHYGWRIDPVYGGTAFHYGTDISGPNAMGQPIISVADGIVTQVNYFNNISGLNVTVLHTEENGDEWSSRYCHMAQISVEVGQEVKRGDVVGAVGSTGKSTGPHLHFELKYKGIILDPYLYISEN